MILLTLLLLGLTPTTTKAAHIESPPGAIIIKRLVQLKQHASDDLHRSDQSWKESQDMCQTTTDLLRQESEQALRRKGVIEMQLGEIQSKFNTTQKSIHLKRTSIVKMDQEIHQISTNELVNANEKLQKAMQKLSAAVEAASPENSRLTLAIAKTERVITSIKQNTAAAAGVDAQEANAEEIMEPTEPAISLLELGKNVPDAEDVGPRFVAAIVKLNDLKVAIEKLRNNSMELYELKRQHAESQMEYARDKIVKIATGLNASRSDLQITRTNIATMDLELKNLTQWETSLNERLTVVKDNYRRSSSASEEMSTFCKGTHEDYREARQRASGVGALVDELTEMTTSQLGKIQEHVIEAKMDVLDNAVQKFRNEIPESFIRKNGEK